MPVDLKKIIFSNEEVQAALVNYCLRTKTTMPETRISRVVVNWESELTSDMHFLSELDSEEGEVLSFSNEKVAAALILYCRDNKDPLPRDAQKVLDPAGDGISLTLRHGWGKLLSKDHPGLSTPWMSGDTDTKEANKKEAEVDEAAESGAASSP